MHADVCIRKKQNTPKMFQFLLKYSIHNNYKRVRVEPRARADVA